jgi:hypothetical protein
VDDCDVALTGTARTSSVAARHRARERTVKKLDVSSMQE